MSSSTEEVELPAFDRRRRQAAPYISSIIVVASVATALPGTAGSQRVAVVVLLVVNSVLLLSREVSDRRVPEPWRMVAVVASGICGSAMLAVASNSVASVYPFFAAGHAGYRYRPAVSVPLAVGVSVLSVAMLWLGGRWGYGVWPAPLGLSTGSPVLIGIARRERVEALRNAQAAVREAQRAAGSEAREHALAERARIARDLHDVLAHSLSGVSMHLEMIDALLENNRYEEARVALGQARSLVRTGLGEARQAVSALREEVLPLIPTISAMSAGAGARFETVGVIREVDADTTSAVIRTVQEALTNAARHAPGAAVSITLVFGADRITAEIVNDASQGPAATTGSGMGLVGMRERAALLGGTVEAGPRTGGRGWRVRVIIPR